MAISINVNSEHLEEAPRERLLRIGVEHLRNDELLSVVFQCGNRHGSVFELSSRVLEVLGGLTGLLETEIDEIMSIPGIGEAKAAQLMAAVELGRRVVRKPSETRLQICSAADAAEYVMDRMRYLKKEHFMVLHLDTKHRILGEETSSIGSLDASIVHPREVFKAAVRKSASAILVLHNHPSGDPTPSSEDVAVTHRLVECGRLLGIDVLDHIVIGDGRFVSLKASGHMKNSM